MKKTYPLITLLCLSMQAMATSWSFSSVPSADVENLKADSRWFSEVKSKQTRYCFTQSLSDEAVTANGSELTMTAGLKITCKASSSGDLRVGYKTALWLGDGAVIRITGLKKDELVKVVYETSKSGTARSPLVGNLSDEQFVSSTSETTATGIVLADGDVTLTVSGGLFFRSILTGTEDEVNNGGGNPGGNPDNPADTERGLDYMQATTIATAATGSRDVIWCAPDGSDTTGDGSENAPYYNLQTAVNKALPGTTIKMKSGTYTYDARINIDNRNGTHDQYITVMCPDGRAVLDFSGMPYHAHSNNPQQGIRLTSSYWHFYKIDITNASDNGMLIERAKPDGGSSADIINRTQDAHDNIIEFCHFYRNGDTGLQMKNLASFNYILNCDSYENKDEDDGDADGFAPKISVGDGNYFYGCRAYNNSDDGYDVFFKKDGGFEDNVTIVFENCLAYENGYINGSPTKGNMNGFKMGSDQGRMNCVLNRCLAVNNGSKGFDQNHNSGDIIMNNCTGYALKEFGSKPYSYRIYEALSEGSVVEITNCIAINDNLTTDKHHDTPSKWGADSKKYGRVEITVGSQQSTDLNVEPGNIQSEDNYADLVAERLPDGSLPWGETTWGHPKEGNTLLVDAGTIVGENMRYASTGVGVPAIQYTGAAPDLGAFELGLADKKVMAFGSTSGIDTAGHDAADSASRIGLVQAFNGMIVLTVKGARAADKFQLRAFTANGQLLGQRTFNGSGTALRLPSSDGVVVLQVEGHGLRESLKVRQQAL